jgi:hypothetical protein
MADVGYDAYDIVSPVSIPDDIRKQKEELLTKLVRGA